MPTGEHLLAGFLVIATLGVAIVFGVRQFHQLRSDGPDTDERLFLRRTARRRLFVSVLLGIVALLVAANYVTGLDRNFLAMGEVRQQEGGDPARPMKEADKATFGLYTLLWVAIG